MMNTRRYAGLMGALGACLSMACSAPAEKSQPSAQSPSPASGAPAVQSPVSINAEMVRIVDHAAHQLWNVEKQGQALKTDPDWATKWIVPTAQLPTVHRLQSASCI
jgi:hypothetical protein